ncbi:MAG TPA: hypothetical protein QGH10_24010 [Armatimonadota bacterium]|nr:hypothetical protein [Armatimonadota bacterium]
MTDVPASRPTRWVYLALGALILTGIGVRLACMPYVDVPFPPDAVYYADVAKNMADGRGCVVDYAWIYARGVPQSFPTPAMGYWMPGMSFYLVPWVWALGPTIFAVRIANVFMAIPFTLLCWWLGRTITGKEGPGLLAAGLAAIDPHLMAASTSADASLPQGIFSCGAMLGMYYGLYRNPKWLGLAGLLAGMSHFMRNDGVLMVPLMGLCVLAALRGKQYRFRPIHLLYFFAPYIICVAPWMIRNTVVFGSPSPPALNRLLILPTYDDIFRTDLSSITVDQWLAQHKGWLGVIVYDSMVLGRIVQWLFLKGGSTFLLFAIPFLWIRRVAQARPFLYYAGILLVMYAFVLPEVGRQGSFVRSFYGILPMLLALTAGGVWMVGEWLAKKLNLAQARVVILVLALVLVAHTVSRLGFAVTKQHKELKTHAYVANAAGLRAYFGKGDQSAGVFTNDPWALHWMTNRPCYMLPPDGMDATLEMAKKLGIRHISLPGAFWGAYPGFEDAVRSGRIEADVKFPTLAGYGGLQVYDLWPTEGRRENQLGAEAAAEGEFGAALTHFAAAAKYVADDPERSRTVAENTARATFDLGKEYEAKGELRAARRLYINAGNEAPDDMDVSEIVEALERLGAGGHSGVPHGGGAG